MPKTTPAPVWPKLTDMKLTIGQPVQLVLHGPQDYKHYSRLIGFVEPEYVLLRVPLVNGWAVPLNNYQQVSIKLFSGVSIFEFASEIQSFQLHPRNLIFLDYPKSVKEHRLREHERVRCKLPVLISTPHLSMTTGFEFHDLSGGGAALVGPHDLGPVGTPLTVKFTYPFLATGIEEQIQLNATIQSAQTDPHCYGIQFEQVDPRILLLVNELQMK
jgi:c-di-GMP-binding flagellar brake protein YcgR